MKINKKFIASATSAALVASAIVPVASAASFSDIENNTHKDAILALADAGIINGYTDGTFRPNQKVTRGNVTKLLGKWLEKEGYEIPADYNTVERFTDVPVTHADQELVKYAALVKDNGVFNGSNGQLQQSGEMSRQQMAAVLVRAIKTVYEIDLIANYKAANFESAITDFDQAIAEYHEAITALEFAGLTTQKTFNPKGIVTRGQFASFLNRAIEYAAKQEVAETVEVESVTAVNSTTLEVVLNGEVEEVAAEDFVFDNDLQVLKAEIKKDAETKEAATKTTVVLTTSEQKAGTTYTLVSFKGEKPSTEIKVETPVAEELKVESVSAINAKTLEVKFNKEITSLDGLTFTTKRGESTVVLTAKLSEDKKSVQLASSTNLVAGDYTVKVTGGDFEDGTNSATVKVEAQKIGNIEFNSEILAKTGIGTATVGFKVYDQYGTDVTGSATSLVNAINWTANVAVDSLTDANGVLTIDLKDSTDFVKDQKILITATDSATGLSKAVNFSVGDEASVKTLTLGDVKLPEDATRVYAGSASAATIEITAEDQYGNKLDKASKLTGITVLSSDASVVPTVKDVDNKPVINIDTTSLTTAKNVTLTVVINATGQTVTKTVEIVKPAEADVVTLGSLETNVVAKDDAAGTFVLPISVTNQFGETMTAKQISEAFSAGQITVTGTGSLGSTADLTIDTNSNSANYGKVVNNGVIPSTGVGTVVVTTVSGKTASANFEAKAARKVTEIIAPKTIITNLVSGAESVFTYQYKDQYGDLITPAAGNTNSDLTWEIEVTDLTGDKNVVTVKAENNGLTGTAEEDLGKVTVTAGSGKSGTAKVTAKLLNASNEVVSQVENTFTVVSNITEGLTYEIGDINTLYANSSSATGITGSDAYAAALNLKAKDTAGKEYVVPTSQVVKVESEKGYIVTSATALGDVTIDAQDNKFVIGAKDSDDIIFPENSNKVTDNLKVTLNTENGLKVITKEVTISKEAPKTKEIKIVDEDLDAANPYEIPTTAKEKVSFTFTDRAAAVLGTDAFVLVKDQYGVWTKTTVEGTKLVLNSVGKATANVDNDNGFEFAGDKFLLDEGTTGTIGYAANTELKYSFVDGDASATITVKVVAEEAPTVAGADTKMVDATHFTLKFSEPVNLTKEQLTKVSFDATGSAGYVVNSVKSISTSDNGLTWNVELNEAIASYSESTTVGKVDIANTVTDKFGNAFAGATDQVINKKQ